MDDEKETTTTGASLQRQVCSSLPPLDPNGQPFSMMLRGEIADLGELRRTLSSIPNARRQLQVELENDVNDEGDKFEDVDDVEEPSNESGMSSNVVLEGHDTTSQSQQQQVVVAEGTGDGNIRTSDDKKKRNRDEEGDGNDGSDNENEEDCEDDLEDQEELIFFLPSVQCSCSSWDMKDVSGDLLVTSLRILFLAEKGDKQDQCDDAAIDGRCIALHAVDSVPSSDGENESDVISHHVYCQLADPAEEDEGGMGYASSAISSMVAPTAQMIEDGDDDQESGEDNGDDEEHPEEDGTVEVYLKPITSTSVHEKDGDGDGNESQSNECQRIFESLTKLVSLNPAGDSDDAFNGGGGLFSMLSMMAGMENGGNGFGGEMVIANHNDDDDDSDSDDDMIFRLGGNNNLVENDDEDDESEGAEEGEREAMLRRLDNMLVVPPEYEIASSEDGQFDDADEDDAIL